MIPFLRLWSVRRPEILALFTAHVDGTFSDVLLMFVLPFHSEPDDANQSWGRDRGDETRVSDFGYQITLNWLTKSLGASLIHQNK